MWSAPALTLALTSALSLFRTTPAGARNISGPAIASNFADPAFIEVDGRFFAFSTNTGGKHVPVAQSSDFNNWSLSNVDALPTVGAWSNGKDIWAPDVIRRADGTFVLYYSARTTDGATHCIGAATSKTAQGTYAPLPEPIACPRAQGGAIDAAGFVDSDGTIYVVYKVDGSSKGGAAPCGNTDPPTIPTPLMLQRMAADGTTPAGAPVQLLDRGAGDGPLIEAPSLAKAGGTYVLFFSSSCFNSPDYDVKYATAPRVAGPYTRAGAGAPLLKTGTPFANLFAPGGLDVSPDGARVMFHADRGTSADVREMYVGRVNVTGNVVTFV